LEIKYLRICEFGAIISMKDLVRAFILDGAGDREAVTTCSLPCSGELFSVPERILKVEMTRTRKGPTTHTNSPLCPFHCHCRERPDPTGDLRVGW